MLKKQQAPKTRFLKRRDFLSRSAAIGGMAVLVTSAGPVHAAGKAAGGIETSSSEHRGIWPGNATVQDFSGLVDQQFRLRLKDGTTVGVKLIETSSPTVRRAPRFRREQFSIILDVPGNVELVQGQYRLSHPQIGSMDLFMVPVDLPSRHNRLEAIFA